MKPTADDRRRALSRAAARERAAGKVLGVRRVWRDRGESAPDLVPVEVAGVVLQPEVKHRAKLPAYLVAALEQAKRYAPEAEPLAVISAHGGSALAVVDLRVFARLVGLEVASELPRPRRRRPPSQPQLDLFAAERKVGGHGAPPTAQNPDGPVKAAGCPQDAPPAGTVRTSTPAPATRQGASGAGRRGGIDHRDLKPENV